MKKTLLILLLLILTACSSHAEEDNNSPYDGNVTNEEAEAMQESWCEYNEGEDFAKEQCEEYWND